MPPIDFHEIISLIADAMDLAGLNDGPPGTQRQVLMLMKVMEI